MRINLGKIVPTILSEVVENSDCLVNSRGIAAALAKKLTVIDGVATADVRFEGALEFASSSASSMVSRKGYYIQAFQIVDSSTVLITVGTTSKTLAEIKSASIAGTFDSSFDSGLADYATRNDYMCLDIGRYFADCAQILSVSGNKITLRPTFVFWNEDTESATYPFYAAEGKFSISLSVPETLDVNLNWLNSVNGIGVDLDTTAWSFGSAAHSIGVGSVTAGLNCATTGSYSASFGEGIYNPFNGCVMVGKYPYRYYSSGGYDPIFVVGDGTPGDRHSAFVVRRGLMEINVDPTRLYIGNVTLAKYVSDHASGISKIDPTDKTVTVDNDVYYEYNTSNGQFIALQSSKSMMYKLTVPSSYGPFAGSLQSDCGVMFLQNISSTNRWLANRNMRVSNGYEVVYNPDVDEYFYTCTNGLFFGKVETDGDTIAWGRYSNLSNRFGVATTYKYNDKTYILLGRGIASTYTGYSANITCNVENRQVSLACKTKWYGANANGWCDPARPKSALINGVMVAVKVDGGLEYSDNIIEKFEGNKAVSEVNWADCTFSSTSQDIGGGSRTVYGNIVVGKDANGNEVGIVCGNGSIRWSTDGITWKGLPAISGSGDNNWVEARFTKDGGVLFATVDTGLFYAEKFNGYDTTITRVKTGNWHVPEPSIINGTEYWITTVKNASGHPIFSPDGEHWFDMFNVTGVLAPPVIWDGNFLFAVTDGSGALKKVPVAECVDAFYLKRAMYGFDNALKEDASTSEIVGAINELRVILKNVVPLLFD